MSVKRGSSVLLAGLYLLLLVYASLYPFDGWRWPAGASLLELARLSWPPWRDRFDEWANLLGYAPFGALLFVSGVRRHPSAARALLYAAAGSAATSYSLEFLQHFVPSRFPSLRDWTNNTAGGALGGVLAWFAHATGGLQALRQLGGRWFIPNTAGAIVLLVLWPFGLLAPATVPMGFGQIATEVRPWLEWAVAATPLESWFQPVPGPADTQRPLSALQEMCAIAAGLAAPCLLACVVTRAGWRRWIIAPVAVAIAAAVLTLSTALNFGPEHAWAWMTPKTTPALIIAVAVCLLAGWASARTCAALALVALTALVAIVSGAPSDPYYAASLQAWERGRFIRFSGVAQWVGLLWPYVTMAWLVAWLGRRR